MWLQCVDCDVQGVKFFGYVQYVQVYVYFGDGVGGVWFELFGVQCGWWGQYQYVWIGCVFEIWQVGLCGQKSVVCVDLMYQVKVFYWCVFYVCQLDCVGVVDQDVDIVEMIGCLCCCFDYLCFFVDVYFQCQCMFVGCFDCGGCIVDGVGQFGIGYFVFGCDDYVGVIVGCVQGDGQVDVV